MSECDIEVTLGSSVGSFSNSAWISSGLVRCSKVWDCRLLSLSKHRLLKNHCCKVIWQCWRTMDLYPGNKCAASFFLYFLFVPEKTHENQHKVKNDFSRPQNLKQIVRAAVSSSAWPRPWSSSLFLPENFLILYEKTELSDFLCSQSSKSLFMSPPRALHSCLQTFHSEEMKGRKETQISGWELHKSSFSF